MRKRIIIDNIDVAEKRQKGSISKLKKLLKKNKWCFSVEKVPIQKVENERRRIKEDL